MQIQQVKRDKFVRNSRKNRAQVMAAYILEPTEHLLGVDVVEEPVGGELLPVLATDVVVEHLQLGLALVELGEVPLLQGYPGMDLVHLQGLQPQVTFSTVPVFRIRIRIQSGQWIRIRIQEGKNDQQKEKKLRNFMF
jgi:hypothetical protein